MPSKGEFFAATIKFSNEPCLVLKQARTEKPIVTGSKNKNNAKAFSVGLVVVSHKNSEG